MNHINTPISRVSCPNVENPETQADQFTLLHYSTTFIISHISSPPHSWITGPETDPSSVPNIYVLFTGGTGLCITTCLTII